MTLPANVWIIDDDRSIRWVLEKALEQADIRSRTFDSGESVMNMLAREQPDAIVSDIRMPGIDGLSLLNRIHTQYPTLPVIVHEFLKREPSLRVFCIIDREDIAAQTKYMICREPMFDFYIGQLLKAFPDNVWPLGADFRYEKKALVLSPDPKLPNFDDLL